MSRRKIKTSVSEYKPSQNEIDDALAALIASTKRQSRKLNPLEVAEKIQIAKDGIGSLPKVAERIGLSYEMLRQIFSVRKCSESVKTLIREGKIDSYDILYRLSKLQHNNQVALAKCVIMGGLTSEDVRAIVTFHREFPSVSIKKVIERIKSSRDIKQYVVYFKLGSERKNFATIRSRFEKIFGKGNIVSLKEDDSIGELVLNVDGKNRLQEEAKRRGLTKRKLIRKIVVEK